MSSRIIQKYINVNTKFRPYVKGEQAKSTDFLVSLPNPIRNVLSMKLKTFNSPNCEYTFTIEQTNNTFQFVDTASSSYINVTIPPGTYTINQLISIVNYSIQNQASTVNIRLDYLYNLNRFVFKETDINTYELNFDVNVNNYIYDSFGWKLGFQKSYYSNKNYSYKFSPVTSENDADPQCPVFNGNIEGFANDVIGINDSDDIPTVPIVPPTPITNNYYLADTPIKMPNTSNYYLLALNDFLNQSDLTFHEACYPSNNIMDNIFARVNTKYALDNNTVYEADNSECYKRTYSGPVTLSKLHIKLYDDNNNIVDLNSADYSFLLELEVKA